MIRYLERKIGRLEGATGEAADLPIADYLEASAYMRKAAAEQPVVSRIYDFEERAT